MIPGGYALSVTCAFSISTTSDISSNVQTLSDEAKAIVRNAPELQDITGVRTATLYRFADDSVGYFVPDAPDWQEADELKGNDMDRALGILQDRGLATKSR